MRNVPMLMECSRCGRLLDLYSEVTEQVIKRALITVVIFPRPKIPDKPRSADVGCPCLVCLHNSVIQPDRKQYGFLPPMFLFKGRFDFCLYPGTDNRMS